MNKVGARIFYDPRDGDILITLGEMMGDVLPRQPMTDVKVVDLEYGSFDFTTHRIVGIDIETKQPIIEKIKIEETDEQRRIRELEDALLLQADIENGGIL